MPTIRSSIPLNDDILSTLRTGVKVRCKPPGVDAIIFLSFWSAGTLGGHRPIIIRMKSLHPPRVTIPQIGLPLMGRQRIMAMSYSVTVVSPHERWNMWVSG
jgi:hypothetical protein